VFIVKQVIESEGVLAKPDTVAADRRKIRDGLAKLKETDGLLGKSVRTLDREAIKPFVFVQASAGHWKVAHTPAR
jgi:branched-chain amino acid transport system substrate-binding protein